MKGRLRLTALLISFFYVSPAKTQVLPLGNETKPNSSVFLILGLEPEVVTTIGYQKNIGGNIHF